MTFWVSIQKSESFWKSLTPFREKTFPKNVQDYTLEIFTRFKVNKLIFYLLMNIYTR